MSQSYFDTLDLPVVTGRAFDERDRADSVPVCMVNEAIRPPVLSGTISDRHAARDSTDVRTPGQTVHQGDRRRRASGERAPGRDGRLSPDLRSAGAEHGRRYLPARSPSVRRCCRAGACGARHVRAARHRSAHERQECHDARGRRVRRHSASPLSRGAGADLRGPVAWPGDGRTLRRDCVLRRAAGP